MGNYLSLLLPSNDGEEELTLENACKLLQHSEEQQPEEKKPSLYIPENLVSNKTGVITQVIKDSYIIDDLYVFRKTGTDLTVGSQVRYNLFSSDNLFKVSNVEILNEWDSEENSDSLWNNRVILCQVEKRVGRQLTLTTIDTILDLDKAPLEFLPIVGDWLQLDVKCIINEKVLDLAGNIIEINKVTPIRLHIETGKVTNWKISEGTGTINNKIFFNKSALSLGYLPVLGDRVVAEVIESDQNRLSWRAIKIIPEYLSLKYGKVSKTSINISDCKDTYPGLDISDVNLCFEKLGESKSFSISILNSSESKLTLVSAEFLDSNCQCCVLNNSENTELLPGCKHEVLCECTAKNMGQAKEFFVLNFGEFILGKWANILVSVNHNNQRTTYEYQTKLKPHEESSNELIRGQKHGVPRFSAFQIPNYPVPQRLIDAITKFDSKQVDLIIDQLKILKPSLVSNLTHLNYEDKFHTLLHLDEIAGLVAIRTYDQSKACFIRNAEYLMLEIDNLSERRPSLIVGDRIIATDPLNKNGLDYEGFINKVSAKHVFIKFNLLFHDSYNGEDYSIKIIPGRAQYKRLHHAVHLATRNLGQELLFPTRVLEKDIQVVFSCEKQDILTSPCGPKKNKMKDVLNKMQEYKQTASQDTSLEEGSVNELKLEWYNKKLNPNQKNAVKHILWGKARPLPYIIFGPPGTGKTVTIIETILQIVRMLPSSRLLVAAPSNSASDLIALRLIDSGLLMPGDLVRVVSYNYALSEMVPVKLVPYCATAGSAKEGTTLSDLTVNTNGITWDCNQTTLGRHRITVATCSASGQFFSMGFPKGHFSHIIVDEAAQAGEPDVMIPMAFLDKSCGQVILAGDPMQLGPVVICKIATECGLNESYLERLINIFPYIRDPEGFPETSGFDPRLVTKLLYNYRALPDILNLYNELFYNNELIPAIDDENSSEAKLLETLKDMLPTRANGKVPQIIFHGVDGENYQSADSPSWYNPHEAAQVFYYVNEFYRLGINSNNLGIITPYIKQVKEIRSLLTEAEFDAPRIGTIEEFQGQEFDIILLSTVRSCEQHVFSDIAHSLGFIASPKRLNVAISRSKSLLVVIGNPKLLCQDTYWRSVVKYCMENGSYAGCDF